MRILIVSDTYEGRQTLYRVVLLRPEAEVVIHLEDRCDDTEGEHFVHPKEMFLRVRGNYGQGSALPPLGEIQLRNRKIPYTHGNLCNVRYTLDEIKLAARLQKATILLFEHTYVPYTEYDNGLYVMSPSFLHGADASYDIVSLTPRDVVVNVTRANQDGRKLEVQRPKGFSHGWIRRQVCRLVPR